jgi:hypothetical protein
MVKDGGANNGYTVLAKRIAGILAFSPKVFRAALCFRTREDIPTGKCCNIACWHAKLAKGMLNITRMVWTWLRSACKFQDVWICFERFLFAGVCSPLTPDWAHQSQFHESLRVWWVPKKHQPSQRRGHFQLFDQQIGREFHGPLEQTNIHFLPDSLWMVTVRWWQEVRQCTLKTWATQCLTCSSAVVLMSFDEFIFLRFLWSFPGGTLGLGETNRFHRATEFVGGRMSGPLWFGSRSQRRQPFLIEQFTIFWIQKTFIMMS